MRKYRFIVAMAIVALAALSFTACGGDDDDNPTPTPSKTLKAISCDFGLYYDKSFLDYFTVEGTYTDINGVTQTITPASKPVDVVSGKETYSLYPMIASSSSTAVPAVFTMTVAYALRSDVTVPDVLPDITFATYTNAMYVYTDGSQKAARYNFQKHTNNGVSKQNLDKYVEFLNKDASMSISISTDAEE